MPRAAPVTATVNAASPSGSPDSRYPSSQRKRRAPGSGAVGTCGTVRSEAVSVMGLRSRFHDAAASLLPGRRRVGLTPPLKSRGVGFG